MAGSDGAREAVALDHWIFGRPLDEGYRVMAVARGMNLTVYAPLVAGHYTPLRGIVSNTVDPRPVDVRMVHGVPGGEELLLSVLERGLPDGAGRDTYRNHTAVLPLSLLRERRLTLAHVAEAAKAFDRDQPRAHGDIDPLVVPLIDDPGALPPLGSGLRAQASKASVEAIAYRWSQERDAHTLLYCPTSQDPDRVDTLYLLLEVLVLAGGLPVPTAISDAPPPSQVDAFDVVISAKGVRSDPTRWAIVVASRGDASYPRTPALSAVYSAIDRAYQSTPRILRVGGTATSSEPTAPAPAGATPVGPAPPGPISETAVGIPPAAPASAPSAPAPSGGVVPTPPAPAPPDAARDDGEAIADPPSTLVSAHDRVATAFDGFVGNAGAVERVSIDLVAALLHEPPRLAVSYLITGNPSTGKTTLAGRLARALGLPLVALDGHAVPDREALVGAIDAALAVARHPARPLPDGPQGLPELEYPPVVIFLDEVHLIPRRVQESLLTLTEPDGRFVRLGNRICRFPYATFVAATTRPEAVDRALRSRFTPEVHLLDPTADEVARIVRDRSPQLPEAVALRIARLSQNVPRVALRLAQELERRREVSLQRGRSWDDHLKDLQKAEGLDDLGFGARHRRVLELLAAQERPIGLDALQNLLEESDREFIEREVLAGLQRAGFVTAQATGRTLTDAGREYLRAAEGPTPDPGSPVGDDRSAPE